MKIRAIYKKMKPNKKNLKIEYDKTSKKRPAWIKVKGLPEKVSFISVFLDKKSGKRTQGYRIYVNKELFLPIDYTNEEMKKFYDKFSENYDKEVKKKNMNAVKFFVEKIEKYINKGKMLDLGAGTGLVTEKFVKKGFYPATLVDFSEKMLNKAKKRKKLKDCEFVKKDLRKLNLNKKFDLILSFFSLGSISYFEEEEMLKIMKIAKKHLKKQGIIAIFGHDLTDKDKKIFKEIDSGIYPLNKKKGFFINWFIGKKK